MRVADYTVWYRGLVVPMEAQDCIVHLLMPSLATDTNWRVYIGAGYRDCNIKRRRMELHLRST